MEELFDFLLVVVVAIIGIIAQSNKNKKKKEQQSTRSAEPLTSVSDRKMINRRNIASAVQAFSELAEAMESSNAPKQPVQKDFAPAAQEPVFIEGESLAAPSSVPVSEPPSGESAVDEHGCIGGSIGEHVAEGESTEEHAEHERRRTERLQAEAAVVNTKSRRQPTLNELRKAVVMSEILDRPVSLRRKGL